MREWTHGREDNQNGLHCFGGCSSKLISRAVAQRIDKIGKGEDQSNIDSMYRDWERLVSGVDPTGSKGKLEGLVKEEDKGWAVSGRKA